jgi:hypothetical protein
MRFRPFYDSMQIKFQMNNWPLTTSVTDVGMIPHVQKIEHDGSWTEIEWDALAHHQPWDACQGQAKSA